MKTEESMPAASPYQAATLRGLLATVIVLLSISLCPATRRERLIDSWKPVHYSVSITFNDRLTSITSARTEITILSLKDTLSQVDLDFGDLTIDSVTVDGQTAPFERSAGMLNVKLTNTTPRGTSLLVAISYHGTPKLGLVLTSDKAGRPSAIGDNWPDRVHHWIPSLDHPSAKATVHFTVTAPSRYLVVANGRLDRIAADSAVVRTWTYSEAVPVPPYCMIIAVGAFSKVEPSQQEITPLSYYVPPSDKNFAMQGFAPANPSLKFFSQTIAPYPYEKLALIIGATRFGGMENSSAILFPNSLFDPRSEPLSKVFNIRQGLVEVVAHEIAHQWFGDSVTAATWSDFWLSEGFAEYFAGLFIQRHEGEEVFRQYMENEAEEYFGYEKKTRAPIHDTETEDLFKLLNPNNYKKGAWVLHMLRSELGDKDFFRGIRAYYDAHQGSTATSEDLRSALEKASGRDLKVFFARWIYGAGHPRYELSWQWQSKAKKLTLTLQQLQSEAAFPNTVPVDILTNVGVRRVVLEPAGKKTIEEFKLSEAPSGMNIDPEHTILKEARVTKRG
jgi:aminopeptidase N